MRFAMLLVGVAGLVAVACGSDDDNGGGGAAGSSSKAGSSSAAGTGSTAGSGNTSGSGGGSTGGGKVDSGASDDTPANELSDAQVDAFCESVGKAAQAALGDDLDAKLCGLLGYWTVTTTGGDKAACDMATMECLAEPGETTDEECTKPGPDCTATVGEIEQCMNDQLTQVKTFLASLPSCDDVGTEVNLDGLEMEPPASCAVVEEKCPEALDNAPDPSGGMFGG